MSESPTFTPFIPLWLENADLTPQQYRVICHFWSRGQGRCFPSLPTIATSCKLNLKTVKSSIKQLEARGLVTRQKRKEPGIRFANEYILTGPNGAPVKSEPAQMEPHLTGPKETPANRPKWSPTNDTPLNDSPLNENKELFPVESKPVKTSKSRATLEESFHELPFQSNQFREVWSEWIQHRKEIKKPLTATSVKMQLKEFSEIGEQRAIAAIHHSIKKGWRGIFEPSSNGTRPQAQTHQPDLSRRPSDITEV
jgi:hypothetical protein